MTETETETETETVTEMVREEVGSPPRPTPNEFRRGERGH